MARYPYYEIEDEEDTEQVDEEEAKYHPSVFFDYEKGDFRMDGANRITEATGHEAYIQWCIKVLNTEREACLAYSDDIGTEFDLLPPSREERESDIERTITEALMVHPATEYVRDFTFDHRADECYITFTVKGYDMEEETLRATVPEN